MLKLLTTAFLAMAATAGTAIAMTDRATESAADTRTAALSLLKRELSARHPGARIELIGEAIVTRGSLPEAPAQARITGASGNGEAQFLIGSEAAGMSAEGKVAYSAWLPAQVAKRRILPGEALSTDGFAIQEINIASGLGHEFRGSILGKETDISALESRQTILEGQFLVAGAVKKIPDVRRGDVVRINLISNGVVLSVPGVASEPAYLNGQIRIMTQRTKRELTGQLAAGRVVEVNL